MKKENNVTIEIIPDYICNSGCIHCFKDEKNNKLNLSSVEIKNKIINSKKKYNATKIAFSGGEPTIRKDIFDLIQYSKETGFEEICLKSNGFIYFYKELVEKFVNHGVDIFHITFQGIEDSVYEKITNIKNSLKYVLEGIDNILFYKKKIIIDLTVNRFNYIKLKEAIQLLYNKGITDFFLWLIINEGRAKKYGKELTLSFKEIKNIYEDIFEYCNKNYIGIKSLFIPYCIFPKFKNNIFNPREENIIMITPQNDFFLENSSLDFGSKIDKCNGCFEYSRCFGIHPGYLELWGDEEISSLRNQ